MRELNIARIGYELMLLGVETRSLDELAVVLACCEKSGLVERQQIYVRANPKALFLAEPEGWKTTVRESE